MAAFRKLKETSNAVSHKVSNTLDVGAINLQLETVEEQLIFLEDVKKTCEAKQRMKNVDSIVLNKDGKEIEESDNNTKRKELMENVMKNDIKEKTIKNIYLANALETLNSLDASNDVELFTFKEKISQLLDLVALQANKLKDVYNENNKVLEEIADIREKSYVQLQKYNQNLEEGREKSEEIKQDELNAGYDENLQLIKKKIKKLNLLRCIITRLLVYGNIDGEEHLELLQLLPKYRHLYTIESISKNLKD